MNTDKEEIPTLEQIQSEIAKKYGLGEKLVTGHAKKYFDEASIEFAKLHVKKALEKASEKTTYIMDKNCVLYAYPDSNIK